MRPVRAAWLLLALAGLPGAGEAQAAACPNAGLGARSADLASRDPVIRALRVDDAEKRLVALDRLVRPDEIKAALACLDAALAEQSRRLPAPFSAYRQWTSDGRIHHFPGNEFSYGRLFVLPAAASYLAGRSYIPKAGDVIVKEAFRFDAEGTAHLHEIAVMSRAAHGAGGDPESGWRWLKIDAALQVTEPVAECRTCHDRQRARHFLFGYGFITQKRP